MARTADEDRSIWKFIQKLGKGWGEQGVRRSEAMLSWLLLTFRQLNWLQKRELQWRKRSAVAREAIRRKEAEAEEAERKFSLFQAKRRSEQLARMEDEDTDESSDESTDESSNDSSDESAGQSTVLDGIIELACRWTAGIRRALSRE
jgi:hypothetical protein